MLCQAQPDLLDMLQSQHNNIIATSHQNGGCINVVLISPWHIE